MKSETNSSNRSYRKIKIKEKVIERLKTQNVKLPITMKLHKIETTFRGKKLFPSKDGNWTNLKLAGRTSKLTYKRTDSSLAKEGLLKRLVL